MNPINSTISLNWAAQNSTLEWLLWVNQAQLQQPFYSATFAGLWTKY